MLVCACSKRIVFQSSPSLLVTLSASRLIFPTLLLISWVFWNVSLFHCSLLRIYFSGTGYGDGFGLGPFTSQGGGAGTSCNAFDSELKDVLPTAMKISRALGLTGYAFHSLALLTVIALDAFCTCKNSPLLWKFVRAWVVAAMLCSIFIFAAFFQETCTTSVFGLGFTCSPGPAGIVAIVNTFVLVALIVVSRKTDAPVQHMSCRSANQDTEPVVTLAENNDVDLDIKTDDAFEQPLPTTVADFRSSVATEIDV